jgi:hypothetical protein
MSDQFEDKMKNDDHEENNMDDEPKEENIMNAESGDMYPMLNVDCDVSELPIEIISDDDRPITGQPEIRVLIDSFSRTILGWRVHIEGLDAEQA